MKLKTSTSIKTNIRQGIAQIMEYAIGLFKRGIELVIIGPSSSTDSSKIYREKSITDFKLPIYFRYFNLTIPHSKKE